MRFLRFLPIAALLTACQPMAAPSPSGVPDGPQARVTLKGTIAYRQRIALPQNARVMIMLADVSRADAAAIVIAETQMETAGRQVPISFALDYDPTLISPRGSYAVSARITDAAGKLLWITDTRFALPAPGMPAHLMLVQVP